jgi:ribosomal protein S27E
MSVRVIGKDDGPRRVVCQKCRSVLEFTMLDVGEKPTGDPRDPGDTYLFVRCPDCGHEQAVPRG